MTETFWLNLVGSHTTLIPLLVGLVACLESLAFIGIAVPGIAILFALSALTGNLNLSLTPLLIAAFCGALLGDQASFFLGRFASPWMEQRWPLRSHPQWQERGQRFFDRYGGYSVILGRFVGPFRPLIPFVAGSCQMSPIRFSTFNILSALAWSPAYLLPGYLTGMSAHHLPLFDSPVIELLIALITLVIAFQQFHVRLHPDAGLWHWLHQRHIEPQRLSILLLLASSSLLFLLTVLAQLSGVFAGLNQQLYALLYTSGQKLPLASELITHLGDPPIVIALGLMCGLLAQLRYRQRSGWGVLIGIAGTVLFNYLLKESLTVPRPEAGQAVLDSYSFPSGHASAASAFYALSAVWLLHGQNHRLRHVGYLLTAGVVTLIALTRVLLGVHWPLDILAGVLEGLAIATVYRYWLLRYPPSQPVALVPTLTLLFGTALLYSLIRTLS